MSPVLTNTTNKTFRKRGLHLASIQKACEKNLKGLYQSSELRCKSGI